VKTNQVANAGPRPGYGPLPTTRVGRKVTHLSVARRKILSVLIDHPEPCTVTSLSTLTHQHPNTIREHLDGLVDDGLALRSRTPTQLRGRPAWLYQSASEFDSGPEGREYVGLASALAGQIAETSAHPRADAIEAGRRWSRDLVKNSPAITGATTESEVESSATAINLELLALLRELGFAPSADPYLNIIQLRRCPLLEAAYRFPEVICGVHLGIIRGALNELGADPDQSEHTYLQAFSEPGACRLELFPPVINTL
jgi:predicted ArsR family transcriptional regulator